MFRPTLYLALLLVAACIFRPGKVHAQAESDSAEKDEEYVEFAPLRTISAVPQYLFRDAIRLDLEYCVDTAGGHWVMLTPQFYNGSVNKKGIANTDKSTYIATGSESMPYDDLTGFGLGIYHKLFIRGRSGNDYAEGFFAAYGLDYRFMRIRFSENDWERYIRDGLTYYRFRSAEHKQDAHQLALIWTLGYRFFLDDFFFTEGYFGMGVRRSTVSSTLPGYRSYSRDFMDYNYSGVILQAGIKIGVLF